MSAKWNPPAAPEDVLDELVYRSHLLGGDRSVCNWGGGNISAKLTCRDHLGRERRAMWVKASGSDLADIKRGGFARLYLDEVAPLLERDAMDDAEMVAYVTRCLTEPGYPRPSIETLLHAFMPATHVDHTHPDAIISIACAPDGEKIAREIYGDRFVWVPYQRPGFDLAKRCAEAAAQNPNCELVIMGKHGLITWGETAAECYANTLRIIGEAADYLERHRPDMPFGGARVEALSPEARRAWLIPHLSALRGAISRTRPQVLRFSDHPEILAFASSNKAPEWSQIGAACPDHLVHTKRQPLLVDWMPEQGAEALGPALLAGVERFVDAYNRYCDDHAQPGDPRHDSAPRVILIPGIGMVTTGKDAKAAAIAAQLYERAVAVMRGAEAAGGFTSLDAAESYAIEYWPLELYKLTLAPPPAELAGKVALVTGGAGAIGRATCERFLQAGAHVVIMDIAGERAQQTAAEFAGAFGAERVLAVQADVTDERAVDRALGEAQLAFGGIDIAIANAGLATSSPIEETDVAEWDRNFDVLGRGYFLTARAAFRVWKRQGTGGALIFVASKNGLVAGKNASVYSAAKAAEVHLARCLAEEGGAHGIRVNTVCPDAVLQGSHIWSSTWREERARAYGIKPEELEAHYRARTTLKVEIYPQDVAEAIAYFASPRAAKTTGCILTVDGGVPAAYTR